MFIFRIFKFECSRLKIGVSAPTVPVRAPSGAKISNRIKTTNTNNKLKIQFSSQTNIIIKMETILRKSADRDKGRRNAKLTEPEYNCDCNEPKDWKRFLENRKF